MAALNSRGVRGLIHVHSDYSYDGKLSITELSRLCRSRGYSFVFLTEHADSIGSQERMDEFVRECESSSTDAIIIIPGVEVNSIEGYHIVGLGLKTYIPSSTAEEVIEEIHSCGGVAVLGHPATYSTIEYSKLQGLDGVEIWSLKHDSRYAPSLYSIGVFRKLKELNPELLGVGGLDLHSEIELNKSFWVTVYSDELNSSAILDAIRGRRFYTTNGVIKIGPDPQIQLREYSLFYGFNKLYGVMRRLAVFIQESGIPIPSRLLKLIHKVY